MGTKRIWILSLESETLKCWTKKPTIIDVLEMVGEVTKKEKKDLQDVVNYNLFTHFKVGCLTYVFEEINLDDKKKGFFSRTAVFFSRFVDEIVDFVAIKQ